MARVYNFSAGPAVLPEEVLKEAADEMLDYKGTGTVSYTHLDVYKRQVKYRGIQTNL